MESEREFQGMKYRVYVLVWLALLILTGITVSASGLRLGGWTILLALLIAGVKSALVLGYFMHLKFERGTFFRIVIPLVLAVLLVFIGLTFSDVAFR